MTPISEADWRGPTRPSSAAPRRHPAPGVEVHHTVSGRARNRAELISIARTIYRDHVKLRGWSDIFYAWLVGDGDLLEVRGYDHLSGKVPHMTVCLVGRYSTGQDQPTQFQLATIMEMRRLVAERGGGRDLTWHSRRDATDCPGGNVIAHLEGMLRRPFPGNGTTHPPHPTPAPVPGSGDDYAMEQLDLSHASATPVRGRHVDNLQGLLLAAGYGPAGLVGPHGRPDGVAGKATRSAVGDFQTRSGLKVDHVVGPRTWRALIER